MNEDGLTKVKVVEVSQPPPPPTQPTQPIETEKVEPTKVVPMAKTKKKVTMAPMVLIILVVVAGLASGYALSVLRPKTTATSAETVTSVTNPDAVAEGQTYGAKEGATFPDKAEGVLVKGGIDGEGSHHLLRDGGPARNVYLTSSVLDLDMFVDHLVEVDGETFSAQKAGWLMDVGVLKVLKLNAQKPFEEKPAEELPTE